MISSEEFVKAWLKVSRDPQGGINEVAAETGLTYTNVTSRAQVLRRQGVKLPKLGKKGRFSGKRHDVNALNRLIEESSNGN